VVVLHAAEIVGPLAAEAVEVVIGLFDVDVLLVTVAAERHLQDRERRLLLLGGQRQGADISR
jgi:hypothetical protein